MQKLTGLALLLTLLSSCTADRIVGRNPDYRLSSGEPALIRQTKTDTLDKSRKVCIWYVDMNDNGNYEKGEPYSFCGE